MRILATWLGLAAVLCGCGDGSGGNPVVPPPVSSAFAAVDAHAAAAFSAQGISGMGLAIYDAQGEKRFEKFYGAFNGNQRVAVASASKLVSGLVIARIIDEGFLTLDSTTGAVLGWTGAQGAITLRQLLSFTSGLEREAGCTLVRNITLAECVALVGLQPLVAAPGTRFDYGSTHLHVAARMAEVTTGQSWANLFAAQLKTPLGLTSPDLLYFSAPRQATGTSNPLIAGGLRATMNEYATLLAVEFSRGLHEGEPLIGTSFFAAQSTEAYADAAIGHSPFANAGLPFHYGLAAWLECAPPATNCNVVSSPGAFGFTPWVDREGGYYAILGMEVTESQSGVVQFAVSLEQDLKPLIRAAL